jgi:RIO-like serine/threonine protein kinase
MDYHLLFCMLSNYRKLYIEQEMKEGTPAKYILSVVERDIDSHIEYFSRMYREEEMEINLANERQEMEETRAELKRKLEAAIAKGKAQRE